ncbi:YggS family pyridoxal phosphate-dependent enzyme [Novosphingopyxis sp.]|uniref:YggS family pyridoxal phosphate-dependent enzyme n=1 Tax=Novosphingopyxis sp. TaxID=2709690 RepID=UPI003B5C95A1
MTDASPLTDIRSRIAAAALRAGRETGDIELIAVSKTRSAGDIRTLLEEGHRSFGENRVGEAEGKWPELRADYPDAQLHMIGQLQSNKAEAAAALFDVIHTVDRPSLVKALGKLVADGKTCPPCFLQVDIGEEEQKGGCAIGGIAALLERARKAGLDMIGLMCIPPLEVEPAPYFALLAKLADEHGLRRLSMGMSADYETAVMLGATQVRVGTALFGPRPA